MVQPTDLTTLNAVKYWLQGNGVTNTWTTDSDLQLGIYITSASRAMLSYMQRPTLLQRTVTEVRSGVGGGTLMLREFPVLSISSLYIGGENVPARPSLFTAQQGVSAVFPGGPIGYVLMDPWDGTPPGRLQMVGVDGFTFWRGKSNIQIIYQTGYAAQSEAQTVPTGSPYTLTPLQLYGRYAQDQGVSYANGTALTKVTGTPSQGQYNAPTAFPTELSEPAAAPTYTFSAADEGAAVLLNYSFVPYDLDQACAKWVGEAWRYKDRIGEKQKALPQGQGTASFDLSMMPQDVQMVAQQYQRAVPV